MTDEIKYETNITPELEALCERLEEQLIFIDCDIESTEYYLNKTEARRERDRLIEKSRSIKQVTRPIRISNRINGGGTRWHK